MGPGTTVATSDDGHAAPLVKRMLAQAPAHIAGTPRRWSRGPVASLADPDLIRMTPMVAAAGCSGFSLPRLRSKRPNVPSGATCPGRAEQHNAEMNIEKLQLPR